MEFKDKIAKKMAYLKKMSHRLKEYQKYSKRTIISDHTLEAAIERVFHLALESVMDIGEIIIAERGLEKPESNQDIILILGGNKIIPGEFSRKFAPAMKFRNILVHHYTEIDINKLYEHLQTDIEDFDTFARHIARYVKKK
jgi:uncharacterized protein YutE (UPF0331/DUF86 family)